MTTPNSGKMARKPSPGSGEMNRSPLDRNEVPGRFVDGRFSTSRGTPSWDMYPDEVRGAVYVAIGNELLAGSYVDYAEIQFLAYGLERDPSAIDSLGPDFEMYHQVELIAALEDSPFMFNQADLLGDAINEMASVQPDDLVQGLLSLPFELASGAIVLKALRGARAAYGMTAPLRGPAAVRIPVTGVERVQNYLKDVLHTRSGSMLGPLVADETGAVTSRFLARALKTGVAGVVAVGGIQLLSRWGYTEQINDAYSETTEERLLREERGQEPLEPGIVDPGEETSGLAVEDVIPDRGMLAELADLDKDTFMSYLPFISDDLKEKFYGDLQKRKTSVIGTEVGEGGLPTLVNEYGEPVEMQTSEQGVDFYSQTIYDQAERLGQPLGMLGIDLEAYQFAPTDHTMEVSPSAFPFGLTLTGESLQTPPMYNSDTGMWEHPVEPITPYSKPGQAFTPLPAPFIQQTTQNFGPTVQPGAMINPRAFTVDPASGKTMLQLAAESAEKYGVPLNILYGVINSQSAWTPYAQSSDGNRYGLAQIGQPGGQAASYMHDIAANPAYSLNYAAYKLAQGYNDYGSYEGAIVGFRDPESAQHYVDTGQVLSQEDAQFLAQTAQYAWDSSLGSTIMNTDAINKSWGGGSGGGGGSRIPAYQAPDPATLREFLKALYSDTLDREATDENLSVGVDRLSNLYRESYDEQVKSIQGQESVKVDPEARVREELQDTGEAHFRDETRENRSMTDWMAQIASYLSSGA